MIEIQTTTGLLSSICDDYKDALQTLGMVKLHINLGLIQVHLVFLVGESIAVRAITRANIGDQYVKAVRPKQKLIR